MADEKVIIKKLNTRKMLTKAEKDYLEGNLKFFDKMITRFGMESIGSTWMKGDAKESKDRGMSLVDFAKQIGDK